MGPSGEMNLLTLMLHAHWSVQGVSLLLLGMSVWTWTVIIHKTRQIRRMIANNHMFEKQFWQATTMIDLAQKTQKPATSTNAAIFLCAMEEWQRYSNQKKTSASGFYHRTQSDRDALQERMMILLESRLYRYQHRLEQNLASLAGVSSAAPFIGLFGTVIGIMSAFSALANNTTQATLAVVAPGIAEALFATAIGLAAAIPAAWWYNHLTAMANHHLAMAQSFMNDFVSVFTRQLQNLDAVSTAVSTPANHGSPSPHSSDDSSTKTVMGASGWSEVVDDEHSLTSDDSRTSDTQANIFRSTKEPSASYHQES